MSLSVDDRLGILQVVAQADSAATRRDAEGYVALFGDDAVLDGAEGRAPGQRTAAPVTRPHLGFRRTNERPPHAERRSRPGRGPARSGGGDIGPDHPDGRGTHVRP